jgi:hypothetical protein
LANGRTPNGTITEEPVMLVTPKDLAPLIDRLQVLFERPSTISQHQGINVTSGMSVDTLREFVELARGGGHRHVCHRYRDHHDGSMTDFTSGERH